MWWLIAGAGAVALFALNAGGGGMVDLWKVSYDRGGMSIGALYAISEPEARHMAGFLQRRLGGVNILSIKPSRGQLRQVEESKAKLAALAS